MQAATMETEITVENAARFARQHFRNKKSRFGRLWAFSINGFLQRKFF